MTENYADPLARWLHQQNVGCDWEPNSPNDIGMGYHHTGDHEADAVSLRQALESYVTPSNLIDNPEGGS